MKTNKVTLRKKVNGKGNISLYLDYYPPIIHPTTGKDSRREFLRLYIFEKPKGEIEKNHNKQTLALAESIRAQRQLDLQNGHFGYKYEAYKNKNFLNYFKEEAENRKSSKSNYSIWLCAIKCFEEYAPRGILLGNLSLIFAEGYRRHILALNNLSINTKSAYLKKFKATLKEAFLAGYIQENIGDRLSGIKEEETDKEFLDMDEIKKLMTTPSNLPDAFQKAFLFSILTGLRFSDVKNLTWNEINHSNEFGYDIRFRQQKTNSKEYIPITEDAMYFAGDAQNGDEKVFKNLSYSTKNNTLLQKWANDAQIHKKVTFHVARHTYATLQITLGTDIYTVSKLLGHRSIKNTQIYAKLTDKKKREAANKIQIFKKDQP